MALYDIGMAFKDALKRREESGRERKRAEERTDEGPSWVPERRLVEFEPIARETTCGETRDGVP